MALVLAILLAIRFSGMFPPAPVPQVEAAAPVECRFGIGVASWSYIKIENKKVESYDLPTVGVGYYLDWSHKRSPAVPGYIKYVNILSVSDHAYHSDLVSLQAHVENDRGAVWVVGNEPDNNTGSQDDIYPETYAERFFELATVIRRSDPTAKITFGTIIMPTTLRIMYLQRSWNRLVELAGSRASASALIDIWTPHGFLINEEAPSPANPHPWGSGIPLGLADEAHHQEVIDITQMINLEMFKTRMLRFRQFMKDNGEQNKPLWLTEWGTLAPSQNPPGSAYQYYTTPEIETAKYFTDTVNWMETATDPNLGLPADQNRLFQKWFWYSLNDPLYHFGGTLVDPLTLKTTTVGSTFFNYEPPAGSEPFLTPDLMPVAIVAAYPQARTGPNRSLVNFRVEVRVRNQVIHNHLTPAVIHLYDENNRLLGTGTVRVGRCGGDGVGIVSGITLSQGVHTLNVVVDSYSGLDADPTNNQKLLQVTALGFPKEFFMPIIANR
jgi:hypothetical protein